jgi:hypothetical protein
MTIAGRTGARAELYGGKLRANPQVLERYGELLLPPHRIGYYLQLLVAKRSGGWDQAALELVQMPRLLSEPKGGVSFAVRPATQSCGDRPRER